ncbi:hypothetical protein FGO68_gene6915 [Halteria grandinella]|uniref:Uncharacterized protein n=1 Tax=Halteria grandinella TaxID=5974 RepID=A0A8J8T4A1_HALGN|nr:hypothetical protein FGO68_gene6915 [Halteria grandinella]
MLKQINNIIKQRRSLFSSGVGIPIQDAFGPNRQDWLKARAPMYGPDQQNLQYEYSEKAADDQTIINILTKDKVKDSILDFWGEGRLYQSPPLLTGFKNSFNLNHQYQLVSNGIQQGYKIPNRIPVKDYDCTDIEKYIDSNTFNTITLMGAPITSKTSEAISRIIRKDTGKVILYDPGHYQKDIIERVLKKINFIEHPLIKLDPQFIEKDMMKPVITYVNKDALKMDAQFSIIAQEYDRAVLLLEKLFDNDYIQDICEILKPYASQEQIFRLGYRLCKGIRGPEIIRQCKFEKSLEDLLLNKDSEFEISLDHGVTNKLSVNGDVANDSYRNAFFHSLDYKESQNSRLRICPQESGNYFYIRILHGAENRLSTAGEVESNDYRTPAFYSSSNSEYSNYSKIRIIPQESGKYFILKLAHGVDNRLSANGNVEKNDYRKAFFHSKEYSDQFNNYYRIKITKK